MAHKHPNHIDFDVATLAKEKGFDPKGTDYFRHNEDFLYLTTIKKHHNRGAFHVAATSHQELADWLTQKHGIQVPANDEALMVALKLLK